MAPVTKSLGVEKFEAELLQPYLNAFEDKISEVRSAATDAVVGVKEAFGVEFVMAKILGPLKASYVKHTYFLNRVVTIDAFKSVLGATVDAGIAGEVFAFLVKGIEDPVPNVRFTTVRALGEGAEYATDADVKTVIRPALDTAKNDSDADVAFFASESAQEARIVVGFVQTETRARARVPPPPYPASLHSLQGSLDECLRACCARVCAQPPSATAGIGDQRTGSPALLFEPYS